MIKFFLFLFFFFTFLISLKLHFKLCGKSSFKFPSNSDKLCFRIGLERVVLYLNRCLEWICPQLNWRANLTFCSSKATMWAGAHMESCRSSRSLTLPTWFWVTACLLSHGRTPTKSMTGWSLWHRSCLLLAHKWKHAAWFCEHVETFLPNICNELFLTAL